jgi:5-methylcytosine-specific restriction endonuclease McrA
VSAAERRQRWVEANPERNREQQRAYRERNRPLYAAAQRRYRMRHPRPTVGEMTPDQAEAQREYNRAYVAANRERINAQKAAARAREDKAVRNEHTRRARLRRRAAEGAHTLAEWLALVETYGGRCLRCGATDRPLTRDHVVPLVCDGTDDIGNIQPLCKPCNSAKGTRATDYRAG